MKHAFHSSYFWAVALCIAIPIFHIVGVLWSRGGSMEESLAGLYPQRVYDVEISMGLKDPSMAASVRTYLPVDDARQHIISEEVVESFGELAIDRDTHGRMASWSGTTGPEGGSVRYRFRVRSEGVEYVLDSLAQQAIKTPRIVQASLDPTPTIQSQHPEIRTAVRKLLPENASRLQVLTSSFEYVMAMDPAPFKGLTDALTVLRLGEASCNGKSRLFAAMCRGEGLPTRLIGGLILEAGTKSTSHQWTEVYLDGFWVPFDPLNGHFASLPAHYLKLYTGDAFLFAHTAGLPMTYQFRIEPRVVLPDEGLRAHRLWQAFDSAGIPPGLLRFLLLMPLGAVVVAFLRNVIGLRTFGLFLPALIAASMEQTGFVVGAVAFVSVLLSVALLHPLLMRWRLLYTPRLVIMLIFVSALFLGLSTLGLWSGLGAFAYVTLFPVVIVAITAERLARRIEETDLLSGLAVGMQTLGVIFIAYLVMGSATLEALIFAFPDLFLVLVAMMLLLGRWTGVRVLELFRFKHVPE